jgi:hypothetical protein
MNWVLKDKCDDKQQVDVTYESKNEMVYIHTTPIVRFIEVCRKYPISVPNLTVIQRDFLKMGDDL